MVTFSSSIRSVSDGAFANLKKLRSTVLNEGLTTLNMRATNEWPYAGNVFSGSALESTRLPSTLNVLPRETFFECENLKRVVF